MTARGVLSAVCAALVLAPAAAAGAGRSLAADVQLSEFTPPLRLELDLASGRFAVFLPNPGDWPAAYPPPARRTGVLPPGELRTIRVAVAAARRDGLVDRRCERAKGAGYPLLVGNAPIPMLTITDGGRAERASRYRICWTPAARRLHAILDARFDATRSRH